MQRRLLMLAAPAALLFATACGKDPEPEASPEQPTLAPGAACDPDVIAAARREGAANDSAPVILGALREWKNRFR